MEPNKLKHDSEITAATMESSSASSCTCTPMPSALWQAVRESNVELVRSIIQTPIAVDVLTELYCPGTFYCSRACYNYLDESFTNTEHVDYTLATSMPLLHFAVTRGELEIVEQLIEMGADLDARDSHGVGVLEYAMECRNLNALGLLMTYGANMDASSSRVDGNDPSHSTTTRLDLVEFVLQFDTDPAHQADNRGTALHFAAAEMRDNAERVARFIDYGVPVDDVDREGLTALHKSIRCMNKPKTVEVLLQAKADPRKVRKNGDFPLMMAVKRGQLLVTKSLLRYKASPNQRMPDKPTILQVACNLGDESIALELIKAGASLTEADQHGTYVIHSVVKSGMLRVIKEVVKRMTRRDLRAKDGRGYTPLLWACRRADKATVKLLLNKGACLKDKTDAEENVLHCLALTSFSELAAVQIAKFLINKGAKGINKFDKKGFTPFHIACMKNKLALVDLFSKRGANIHLRTKCDNSPLLLAVRNGSYASVLYFLKLGLKINEVCPSSGTALHLACEHGLRHTIQVLLDQGADINVLDSFQRTPFCMFNQLFESCKIMIRHIAKMIIRGEHVNQTDMLTITMNENLCEIYDNCIAELTMMQTSEFYKSITWLDVLFMPHDELETLYKNWMFVEMAMAHLKEKPCRYPLYHREVRAKLESSRMKRIIIEEAEEFLIEVLSDYLPVEIIQHIARLMMRKELNRIENRRLFDC